MRITSWMLALLVACAACSTAPETHTAIPVDAATDVSGFARTFDGSLPDSTPDEASSQPADVTPDIALTCPGQPGCACLANAECGTNLCIDAGDGTKVCATLCVDSCAAGQSCAQIPGPSGNLVSVCVARWPRLCDPCAASKDCASLGLTGSACVDAGAQGRFCGVACKSDSDCPAGDVCKSAASIEGSAVQQCVPAPVGEVAFGSCACSKWAIQEKLSTACWVQAADASGKVVGKCPGVRACGVDGLSACLAAAPTAETCNGLDDDCNGQTDEGTCDDGKLCTKDACDGQNGCKHTPLDGQPCDADGSACTQGDACLNGMCEPGSKLDCDDKNPCTKDSCDMAAGCTQVAFDGAPCDDENPCTIGDVCEAKKCKAGEAKECTSSKACIVAECDLTDQGKCKYSNKNAGISCDDDDACTKDDGCQDGACEGTKVACDDGNSCTDESCGSKAGCLHTANNALCDADGNACSQNDACQDKACVAGAKKLCDDSNPCTSDSCDVISGKCVFDGKAQDGKSCDADGSVCTLEDACKGGQCAPGSKLSCDDKNVCTTDSCDAKTGCVQTANSALCDADGNACTQNDACQDKACVAGAKKLCDDSNPCTSDSCDTTSGKCVFDGKAQDGKACDADGSVCTLEDACKGGQCEPGSKLSCDDKNVCTTDSCDAKAGCVQAANTAPCDADGNACTQNDACQGKTCVAGAKKLCNDSNPCTSDSCDTISGSCVFDGKPQSGKSCDADGSVCTLDDACAQGTCVAGAKKVCDDGNVCTDDSCEAKTGCVKIANAVSCTDGNACTDKDVCTGGSCKGGLVNCDDGNACTSDSCSPTAGCQHAGNTGSCSDADLCTTGDHCASGSCIAPGKLNCDDVNPCTNDACNPKNGCSHTNNTAQLPCYSGAANTAGIGMCKAGTAACGGGKPGACQGEIAPKPEACNGFDDDCNGQTDEALGSTTCGKGSCLHTAQNCLSGVAQTCDPLAGSSPDICNDLDDDCNGVPDDGCPPDLFLNGTSLSLSGNHTYDHVKLTNGAALAVNAFDGAPCSPGSGTAGSGTLTIIARLVEVDATSSIQANAKGGGGTGCAESSTGTKNDSGAGGGHGGQGGNSAGGLLAAGAAYGMTTGATIHMGSNGSTVVKANSSCGASGTNPGGVGGGLVKIACGKLQLQGTISADGGAGQSYTGSYLDGAGGGSGGGVLIQCDVVDFSGLMKARGGAGGNAGKVSGCSGWGGGGGAGGRVKVIAPTYAKTGSIQVNGGSAGAGYGGSPTAGGAGTSYP